MASKSYFLHDSLFCILGCILSLQILLLGLLMQHTFLQQNLRNYIEKLLLMYSLLDLKFYCSYKSNKSFAIFFVTTPCSNVDLNM